MTDQYAHDASASTRRPAMSKSWRDVLPVHPAADLFPLMPPDELRALGEDIKEHGLTSPIAVTATMEKDGCEYNLVDGRNRLDAMEMVGILFKLDLRSDRRCFVLISDRVAEQDLAALTATVLDPDADPYAYVTSINIHRRHLTAELRQNLLIEVIARTPTRSNRQLGKEIGVDHKTIARARTKGEDVGRIPHVETHTDSKGRNQQARKAAKFKSEPTKAQLTKHKLAEIDRAVARSEGATRTQAIGNAVDPETSAEQRKAEAAAGLGISSTYTALVNAWDHASPKDRERFLRSIGASLNGDSRDVLRREQGATS